jgi:antitoxin (DNA-binding transcriptional repressor) of toxin-antitoxin stability system
VRELRQQASRLLDRVAAGESIEITSHGHPVARLVPVGGARVSRADLMARGDLLVGHGSLADLAPVPLGPDAPGTEELLAQLRDDR